MGYNLKAVSRDRVLLNKGWVKPVHQVSRAESDRLFIWHTVYPNEATIQVWVSPPYLPASPFNVHMKWWGKFGVTESYDAVETIAAAALLDTLPVLTGDIQRRMGIIP